MKMKAVLKMNGRMLVESIIVVLLAGVAVYVQVAKGFGEGVWIPLVCLVVVVATMVRNYRKRNAEEILEEPGAARDER